MADNITIIMYGYGYVMLLFCAVKCFVVKIAIKLYEVMA